MRKTVSILLIILASLVLYELSSAQYNSRPGLQSRRFIRYWSDVKLKAWPRRVPDKNKLEIILFTEITYDILQFIKTESQFQTNFEHSISIIQGKNTVIFNQVVNRTITVDDYITTNSKNKFHKEYVTVDLDPGDYTILLVLRDKASSEPIKLEYELTVNPMSSSPLASSDILFFYAGNSSPVKFSLDLFTLNPVISASTPDLYVMLDYYTVDPQADVITIFKIQDMMGTIIKIDSSSQSGMSGNYRRSLYAMPDDLPFGQYSIQSEISTGTSVLTSSAKFSVHWAEHSKSMSPGFETAIGLMKYLLSRHEWKTLQELNPAEQHQFLEDYWKNKDPVPETEENELQEEFYRRTAYANANFSWLGRNGWETDRGRIYILYGAPSYIERPPSPTGRNQHYELWVYNSINKKFVFMDKHKTGDYKLYSET